MTNKNFFQDWGIDRSIMNGRMIGVMVD